MATTTDLQSLKINYLTQEQYDTALNSGQINANELYCVSSDIVNIGSWILDANSLEGHLNLKYN